jgi:hypothetical protein
VVVDLNRDSGKAAERVGDTAPVTQFPEELEAFFEMRLRFG